MRGKLCDQRHQAMVRAKDTAHKQSGTWLGCGMARPRRHSGLHNLRRMNSLSAGWSTLPCTGPVPHRGPSHGSELRFASGRYTGNDRSCSKPTFRCVAQHIRFVIFLFGFLLKLLKLDLYTSYSSSYISRK